MKMPDIATPGADLLGGGDAPAAAAAPAATPDAAAVNAVAAEAVAAGEAADGAVVASPIKFDAFDVPETHLKAVQAKGWKSVGDVLESYASLEKLAGLEKGDDLAQGRVLIRPKPDAKPEEIAEFFGKAVTGLVPKEAKDYGITAPEGVDPAPFDQAAELFRSAELPKPYADKLIAAVGAAEKAKVEQFQVDSAAEVSALQGEWGDNFDKNLELGRRAAKAAGLDGDALNRIELAVGTGTMLKAMAEFGKQYAEFEAPKPGQQGKPSQFAESIESAKTKIDNLNKDAEFQARYLSPNPAVRQKAIDEMEALLKVAHPQT
jgi:hypothetical protein